MNSALTEHRPLSDTATASTPSPSLAIAVSLSGPHDAAPSTADESLHPCLPHAGPLTSSDQLDAIENTRAYRRASHTFK